jgi:trans-2,3-dihydro-3-hydroxyanthranilate isomerase
MPDYQIKIVDAFTSTPYTGNPCGVVTRAEGLSDAQMQAIAREINASETVFAFPSEVADFKVRFFTPAREIPLAGHPTISVMHALVEDGRIDASNGTVTVTQETKAGVLPVDVTRQESGVFVRMTQATPKFLATMDPGKVARALRIDEGDLLPGVTPQVVSTGTAQGMIMVRALDVLERLKPNFELLADLERHYDSFSTHVFTLETFDPANRAHARHYGANAGVPEDPVTGSATGGMAAYLWRYGHVRESRYQVEQGDFMGRPGRVKVEVEGDGDTPTTVRIGGAAVTVVRGTISA